MSVQAKRIYDPYEESDGRRVLVDRLWPRGVSKQKARLDDWVKDVAPSTALRTWFDHQDLRFEVFAERYRAELQTDEEKKAAVTQLLAWAQAGPVTLLYAAKNPTANHAAVLLQFLQENGA